MTPSVAPILLGEDYQHLYFWIQAARLFMEDDPAEAVFIEHPIIRAFDDVVALNRIPLYSHDNRLIEVDHFQLKYHVDGRETIKALDLSAPSFIGATTHSLLDRAYAATRDGDIPRRLTLVTAWRLDQDDALNLLVSNNDGEIVTDRLFRGGPTSKMGVVREAWRAQLDGACDEDLARVLRHIRIWDNVPMRRVKQDLVWALSLAGYAPPLESSLDNTYIAMVRRFITGGPREHSADTLRPLLKGQWRGRPIRLESDPRDIAIKSFSRGAINLEDHAVTLSLVSAFHGREKVAEVDWDRDLAPRVRAFLEERVDGGRRYDLYLDTHLSIAYLAGYLLGKGDAVAPVQSEGRVVWRPTGADVPGELWTVHEEEIGDGPGLALAVEVTRPVADDVRIYAAEHAPGIGRMLVLTVAGGTGPTSVRDGDHAWALARDLGRVVEARRTVAERAAPMHVFGAMPVALAYLVGREGRAFGQSVTYEFDFENRTPGGYASAFHLPMTA